MDRGSKTIKATAWEIRLRSKNSDSTGRLCMLRTLDGIEVAGKRILVRADLNLPIMDGRVAGNARVRRSVVCLPGVARR